MRRRSESEISERKRQRAAMVAAAPPPGAAAAPPAMPYDRLLERLHQAVDRQYARTPYMAVFEEFHLNDPERADVLSARAAKLFEQIRQRDPNDRLALHHLAVIHHGTGYRLHLDKKAISGQAIVHWKKGIQAWAELVRDNGLWDALRARWQQHREKNPHDLLLDSLLQVDLNDFRRHIPSYLLSLHAAIAREYFETDPKVAKAHLDVILESHFEPAAVENARKRLFQDLVGDVPGLCQSLRFAEAREKAERYARMDGNYVPALCSVLQTCCAECKHLGVGGQQAERRLKLLQACEAHATHPALRQQAEHDMWAAEALRDFYLQEALAEFHSAKACGNAFSRRDASYARALERIKQAIAFERCGHEAREYFQVICFAGAMDDINCEGSDRKLARRLLDAGLAAMARDPELTAVNAYYYLRQGDETRFREELRKAETYNKVANNSNAANIIARLHDAAQENTVTRQIQDLMQKGVEAMQNQDFKSALRHWNALEGYVDHLPNDVIAVLYLRKAQCEFLNSDPRRAAQSHRKACQHATSGLPYEVRKELEDLSSILPM